MARTLVSVQGIELNDDGSPATGTICAKATAAVVNDGVDYPVTPICGLFDAEGRVIAQSYGAFDLEATDDADTTPPGTAYVFTIQIDGEDVDEFTAALPEAATAVEPAATTTDASPVVLLTALVASIAMIGQSISGTNVPDATTVIDADPVANTVTLSADATGTGTVALTVGGAVLLADLEEAAL